MINSVGLVTIIHSFLVALKPVFTRVLMIAVVLHEFSVIANTEGHPQSGAELFITLIGLFNGLLIFIIVVPIIIYLERFFQRLSLTSVSGIKDRSNLEIGVRLLTCLWGLMIVFIGFYVLYDFWKMCIFIFSASVGVSFLLLNIVKLAIGRDSFLVTLVFLNFGSLCFYLILTASFFLYQESRMLEFDMLFVLIMLPRTCFSFITKLYQSYSNRLESVNIRSIVIICFSPSRTILDKPRPNHAKQTVVDKNKGITS